VMGELAGTVRIDRRPNEAGDVTHTWADTSAAQRAFGYAPRVSLRDGLAQQVAWHRSLR
jgi:nucleoside-diphosphate-sugar epimerase